MCACVCSTHLINQQMCDASLVCSISILVPVAHAFHAAQIAKKVEAVDHGHLMGGGEGVRRRGGGRGGKGEGE